MANANYKPLFSSASEHWRTPEALYKALDAEFHFTFDPCPLGGGKQDGLSTLFTPWHGKRVFCNPPYGPGIGEWIERGLDADVAAFLIPARTDTRWFHDIVLPMAAEIRFVRGRLKFGNAQNGAPFPSMIVIFRRAE
jgi:site-specific DNA-methyltransferase (adenine-specific)